MREVIGRARALCDEIDLHLRSNSDFRGRPIWPFFHHVDRHMCASDDMAWSQRQNADHGTSMMVVQPLGLGVGLHTVTKGVSDDLSSFEAEVTTGWTESSGSMGPHATRMLAKGLFEGQGSMGASSSRWDRLVFAHDGDASAEKPNQLHPRCIHWTGARCCCHACKNSRNHAGTPAMGKAPCPGRGACPLTGPKVHCKHEAGNRVGGWLAGRLTARLHAVLRHAVFIYLPELADPSMRRYNDVGSARRRELMAEAKVWLRRQLVAMFLHFIGIHDLCEHGALATDHHMIKCKGQHAALANILLAIDVMVDDLLTDFGLVNVNANEAFNSALAKFRLKILQWSANANVVATNMAFLFWQQLYFSYWKGDVFFEDLIAEEIGKVLPVTVTFTPRERARAVAALHQRVSEKHMWQDPEYRAKKYKRRSTKRSRRSSSEASSVYLGNGTDAGLEAAVAGAGSSSSSSSSSPGPAAAAAQPSAGAESAAGYYNGGLPAEDQREINGAVIEGDDDDKAGDRGPYLGDSGGSDSD